MKNFVGKLLFVAFACMALLIAIKFKEIKKEYLDGFDQASSKNIK
ncbi:hypothetical protein AQBE111736_03345 [Aquirufa beregesia]|nr:hypothetical protein [Aquirufa beregesia]